MSSRSMDIDPGLPWPLVNLLILDVVRRIRNGQFAAAARLHAFSATVALRTEPPSRINAAPICRKQPSGSPAICPGDNRRNSKNSVA